MVLTQYETRIARALADVLFAATDTLPDPDTAGVIECLAMYIGALDVEQAAQMRAMLVAFDVGFPVVMKTPTKRFIDASFEEQQEYIRRAEATTGNARMAYDGVRLVMLVAYAESNAVATALGVGPRVDEPRATTEESSQLTGDA